MSLIKRAGNAERNISARTLTHTREQRIMTRGRMNRHGPWTLSLEREMHLCTRAALCAESPLGIPDASMKRGR